MISLTEEERERFAAYLKQEASTITGLAKTMESLPGGGNLAVGVLVRKYQIEAAACEVVASMLSSTHEV